MLNAENARVKKRKHWLLFSCRWMVGSLAATFIKYFPSRVLSKVLLVEERGAKTQIPSIYYNVEVSPVTPRLLFYKHVIIGESFI